jgi:hypothetical protein
VAHPVYRRDAEASRTLMIENGRLIDAVTIAAKSGDPKALGLSLHVQGNVRLPDNFQSDANFAKGRPPAFQYWTDVQTAAYHNSASFDVDYGPETIRITFELSGDFHVWHGSTPDSPPRRREGFYLETEGTSATFRTTFEPARPATGS